MWSPNEFAPEKKKLSVAKESVSPMKLNKKGSMIKKS